MADDEADDIENDTAEEGSDEDEPVEDSTGDEEAHDSEQETADDGTESETETDDVDESESDDAEGDESEVEEVETAMEEGEEGEAEDEDEVTYDEPVVKSEGTFYGTGRRKESVARVWIEAGNGNITVNETDASSYFNNRVKWINSVNSPLECVEFEDDIDVWATAEGGGLTGQSEALQLGIARALVDMDPNARGKLKPEGHLTRDDRQVERKKINQPGARAKNQVSKR